MATKNSGISARLSLDSAPWEKSLLKASKDYKDFASKIGRVEGVKLNAGGWGAGFGGNGRSGNTAEARTVREVTRATLDHHRALESTNATLTVQRKLIMDVSQAEKFRASQTGGTLAIYGDGSPRMMRPAAAAPNAEINTRAQLAINNRVVAGHREIGASSKSAGMGVLQLSYAMDDLQYGMRGVLNNIPNLVQGFGGSAGMAGAVAMLTLSLYTLKKAYDAYQVAAAADVEGLDRNRFKELAAGRTELARQSKEAADFRAAQIADSTGANVRALEVLERQLSLTEQLKASEAALAGARLDDDARREVEFADREKSLQTRMESLATHREENRLSIADVDRKKAAKIKERDSIKGWSSMNGKRLDGTVVRGGPDQYTAENQNRRDALQAEIDALTKRKKDLEGLHVDMTRRIGDSQNSLATARNYYNAAESAKGVRGDLNEARNIVVRAFGMLGDEVRQAAGDVADKFKQARQQRLAGEATHRDLSISEIRNPRRRERAERAASFADETQRLVSEEGMTPGQAADVAARKQRVADRAAGKRTIRGGMAGENTASGLDSFGFGQRGHGAQLADGNVPTAREAAESRGQTAIRRAKVDAARTGASKQAGNDGGHALEKILAKLDQIVTAAGKTPAERVAPLKR